MPQVRILSSGPKKPKEYGLFRLLALHIDCVSYEGVQYEVEKGSLDKVINIFAKYLKSAKLFDKYSVKIAEFFSLNKQEILSLISSFKLAKKISNNLPQEKEESIIAPENVYKYFGDISGAINLCTFLREKGVFELF